MRAGGLRASGEQGSLTSDRKPVSLPSPRVQVRDGARSSSRGLQPRLKQTAGSAGPAVSMRAITCQEEREPGARLKANVEKRRLWLFTC